MASGTRVPLAEAEALAHEVRAMLASDCERIEVAGSIRRRFGYGALLPDGWHVADGVAFDEHGEPVPMPEERDVFTAYGVGYIEPEARA